MTDRTAPAAAGPDPADAALDAALAALAAAPPPPVSQAFLDRAARAAAEALDARAGQARVADAATSPPRAAARGRPSAAPRRAVGARSRAALALAASAMLGFFAGWTDPAGLSQGGFDSVDLLGGAPGDAFPWEDAP